MQIYLTFPSVGLISFVSSIIARRVAIYPKKFDTDWCVIPNVWGAIVGQPGVQKSPSLNQMFAPLRKREIEMKTAYEAEVKQYQKDLETWKGQNKKKGDKPLEPVRRSLFVNDATMEAMHKALSSNPQGILLYRDELSGFIETMSRSGREGERQFYLEGWSGDGTSMIKRISRDDVDVDGLCLTVFGGIQPSVLSRYISNAANGKADDGFIQRFQLLVSSVPKPDYVLTDTTPDAVAKNSFDTVMTRLLDLPIHGTPVMTNFAQDAQPIFNQWLENLERRIRMGSLPSILASHVSKYRVNQEILPKVSLVSLELAIKWVKFLEKHARNLLLDSPGENSPSALLAERILQKFKSGKLQDGGTDRQLRRLFRAKADNQYLDDAIALLEEFGWIKSSISTPKLGGPKSKVIFVNPCFFEIDKGVGGTNGQTMDQTGNISEKKII